MSSRLRASLLAVASLFALLPGTAAQAQEPAITKTDNVELVAHAPMLEASDLYFQRREGRQMLDGQEVDRRLDLLAAGGDGDTAAGGGITLFDVTDPTAPVELANIACPGFHADVGIWEHLLVQAFDSSVARCDDPEVDPDGIDQGMEGLRIFDITDPANPRLLANLGPRQDIPGVHNVTIHPEAGLAYLGMQSVGRYPPLWGWVDLTTGPEDFEVEVVEMTTISPTATDGCHDMGLDLESGLAFCPAVESSYIWDISDPKAPTQISAIFNPAINIHHGARLAPDGTTLVLNDELAGALSPGSNGCFGGAPTGAIWLYDISDPSLPVPMGAASTDELDPVLNVCTSHFYNFVPDQPLIPVGWYRSGILVFDYSNTTNPTLVARFLPEGASFWTAYYWRGFLYGASRLQNDAAGVWVVSMEGLTDQPPSPHDEGVMWSRYTGAGDAATGAPAEEGPAPQPAPEPEPEPEPAADEAASELPATGGGLRLFATGLVLASAGTLLWRRRHLPVA